MSFDVVKDLRRFADEDSDVIGRDILRRELHSFADKFDETIDSIITHYKCRIAKQAGVMAETAKRNMRLAEKLKVAEDALEKLQGRLVASVYDGTIDPRVALEIADNALDAIRRKAAK